MMGTEKVKVTRLSPPSDIHDVHALKKVNEGTNETLVRRVSQPCEGAHQLHGWMYKSVIIPES